MKKSLILLFSAIFIFSFVIAIVIVNSKKYKYKQANKKRIELINSYNRIERRFIYEGVYSFIKEITKKYNNTNEFGISTEREYTLGYQPGKLSFTEKKLIIIYNDIREEFEFDKTFVNPSWDTISTTFFFRIKSWYAYNSNNVCIYSWNKETFMKPYINDFRGINYTLNLTVKYNEPPHFFIGPNKFYSTKDVMIEMKDLLENYNTTFLPTYIQANYTDEIYDISSYIDNSFDFLLFKID